MTTANGTPDPTTQPLRDRVILVTGAGDGIGRATALACARAGATLVLLGKTIPKLEAVYDEIESCGAPQPAIYPMNLEGASVRDHEDLAATLEREFGRLDGLVHNAAMLGPLSPIAHYDVESWFRVLQVNLNAPFLLTRALLGLLNASQDASVVFLSDRVGRRGRAYWGAYGVSKAGIEALMQILADELEENTPIRVNSYAPGAVRTGLRRNAYPAEDPDRNPEPEAVVGPLLYLLGPESRGITGRQFDISDFD